MENENQYHWEPYNVSPLESYTPHQNENGETLPNCCPHHKKVFEEAKKWALSFLPEKEAIKFGVKTALQVAYTEHYITTALSWENAYEHIARHIEYNVFSFGSRKDYQPYIFSFFGFFTPGDMRFANETSLRLQDLIFMWYKNSLLEVDIWMLREVFKKWHDLFPFGLSIFKGLKENVDFFYELLRYDLGDFTPESFKDELSSLTESILAQINTLTLFEEGVIDEPSKLKLEFIISARRLKLSIGQSTSDSTGPVGYERILKKWFKDEKKFIDEIGHLIKPETAESEAAQPEIMIDEMIESIWEQLNAFKFSEYLRSKGRSEDLAKELFLKHKGSEFVPYCMAFFHETGFKKYFFDNYYKIREEGYKKLGEIFDIYPRSIKGNILVLNPKSTEDRSRYTSGKYLLTIQKELRGRIVGADAPK